MEPGGSCWLFFAVLGSSCFSGYSQLSSTVSRIRYLLFAELEMLSDATEKQWSSMWWGPGVVGVGGGVGVHLTKPCPKVHALPPSHPLQALVPSLLDCDISLLIGFSVSRFSPILPSTYSYLTSQETVAKGATEGCRAGEWQNQNYTPTDSSHNSSLSHLKLFISLTPFSQVIPSP